MSVEFSIDTAMSASPSRTCGGKLMARDLTARDLIDGTAREVQSGVGSRASSLCRGESSA
jgi:hypothetical protein